MEVFNVNREIWGIQLDTIESIANLEPIPRTEHYYAGKAWIMMKAEDSAHTATERAIENFQKALELKPGGWTAMEGLAMCYGNYLCMYETAIRWMEDALCHLPQMNDLKGSDIRLRSKISDWQLLLGYNQESAAAAQTAYEESRGILYERGTTSGDAILRIIKRCIEALFRTERYSEVTDLLFELDSTQTRHTDSSLWTTFLKAHYDRSLNVLLFEKIGKIAHVEKSNALQDFMRLSIKNAVKLDLGSIAEGQSAWLATQAAEWQYQYAPKPEESIELWEEIVRLVDQSNEVVQQRQAEYRIKAARYLSMMFFNAATLKYKAGEDFSAQIKKLEDLANHKQGNKRYYRASYPALSFGLWLHEYAKAEEIVWRACFRPSIQRAIYLLSDEDPWNDCRAYGQLGQALLVAGDIVNASIALGITMKPYEDQRTIQQQSNEAHHSQRSNSFGRKEAAVSQKVEEILDGISIGEGTSPEIEHWEISAPASEKVADADGNKDHTTRPQSKLECWTITWSWTRRPAYSKTTNQSIPNSLVSNAIGHVMVPVNLLQAPTQKSISTVSVIICVFAKTASSL